MAGTATASAASATTSVTIALPTGAQAGDQVIVASTQQSSASVTPPSGYTSVANVTSRGTKPVATFVFRHTVASGDSQATFTYAGSSPKALVLATYRGVDAAKPVDITTKSSAVGATSVTAPSGTTKGAQDRLLLIGGALGTFSAPSWTPPTGMAEQAQSNATPNVSAGIADQGLSAAGSTGSRKATFNTAANLTAVLVALPAPVVLYLHHDQLGSTRMLTDGTGAVKGTLSYDAYGNPAGSTGSASTPLAFAGQYRDSESGLYYLRARYYDPTTAQFLTRDPLLAQTRSAYGYVAGNPLNLTDPSGKCGLWGSDTCWGDEAGWVVDNAQAISAVSGAFALIPTPLSPVLAGVSLVTGDIAAIKDSSHGNYAGATLDVVGGLGGGVSLIAAKYASWLADAAEGSSALLRASPDLQSGLSWSAEGLSLTQRAGFWRGVSGLSGAFAAANGATAWIVPSIESFSPTPGRCG
ncbi:MAG: RHS repeat-associated core domain-containing protein [Solirubrobacteraceae bacterium]